MDGNARRITRSASRRTARSGRPSASASASASPGADVAHVLDAQQSLREMIAAAQAMRQQGRQGSVDQTPYQHTGLFYRDSAGVGQGPHMGSDEDADGYDHGGGGGDDYGHGDGNAYVEPTHGGSSMADASAAVAPAPAARRLFHQFRDPNPYSSDRSNSADTMRRRSLSHESNSQSEDEDNNGDELELEPEPEAEIELYESESESESSDGLEASYLARRIAMTHQRNTLSPSASFPASATNSTNNARRYLNIRDVPQHLPDEEAGAEYEHDVDEYADDHDENENLEPVEDPEVVEVEEDHNHEIPFDLAALGLKEISNLGRFTVNSHKQGSGVDELRSDDLKLYWQSDGPQPHKLTVYFIKRVAIRAIRFYVNHEEDESYTPTKIVFKSGTGENSLIEFASVELEAPTGWQDVPIVGCGGGLDGNTLVSYVFQMVILENHQNGKDTHLRGIKIYAQEHEERAMGGDNMPSVDLDQSDIGLAPLGGRMGVEASYGGGGGLARFAAVADDDEDEEEVARRKKTAQDALLDEWISDSLLKGPTSVASMALR